MTSPSPGTVTVLLVEDHVLFAQSLRIALTAQGLRVDTAALTSREGIVEYAAGLQPDVILLDLDLGEPIGKGDDLVAPLAATCGQLLVVSATTDRPRLAACIEAGAGGFVLKTQSLDELVEATVDAAELQSLLSVHQRQELLAELRRQRIADRERLAAFERLTAREAAVLRALIEGKPAELIAREAVVSEATVRTQIRAVLAKLGVNSQLGAVAVAKRAGWPPPAAGPTRTSGPA